MKKHEAEFKHHVDYHLFLTSVSFSYSLIIVVKTPLILKIETNGKKKENL
jgi:hypothetical protein